MVNHDHPRFADVTYLPSFRELPQREPVEFDSMAVDDDSTWILCASCNRLRVEREGDTCKLCAFFLAAPTPGPVKEAA